METIMKRLFIYILLILCVTSTANAKTHLVVATDEMPPFSMKDERGIWHGITIDLWKEVAARNGYTYDIKQLSLTDIFSQIKTGEIDVGLSAITITSEREREYDFSYPYFSSPSGIATKSDNTFLMVISNLISVDFIIACINYLIIVGFIATIIWYFERNNPDFGKGFKGWLNTYWFTHVVATTVGLGDKAPKTARGRLATSVWMYIALILVSSFIATLAATATLDNISETNKSVDWLSNKGKIATSDSTASSRLLTGLGIRYSGFDSAEDALESLKVGKHDVVFYDYATLKHLTKDNNNVTLHKANFNIESYGILFKQNSKLREEVNRSVIDYTSSSRWSNILKLHLN